MSAALDIIKTRKPERRAKTAQVVAIKKHREFTDAKNMLFEKRKAKGFTARWSRFDAGERKTLFYVAVMLCQAPPEAFKKGDSEKSFTELNQQQRTYIKSAVHALADLNRKMHGLSAVDFYVKGDAQC